MLLLISGGLITKEAVTFLGDDFPIAEMELLLTLGVVFLLSLLGLLDERRSALLAFLFGVLFPFLSLLRLAVLGLL